MTTPEPLLPWRTRAASRHLLLALVYCLGIVAATGLLLALPLPNAHLTLVALAAHLVSGLLAVFFFVPFLVCHLRDGHEPLLSLLLPWRVARRCSGGDSRTHRLLGYGLTLTLLTVAASGLVIIAPAVAYLAGKPFLLLDFWPGNGHRFWLMAHAWGTLLLVALLFCHFPKRSRP
ncbi:MAG: hypothetical protein LBC37_00015 [Zoogloeaceae bacterium]|jgi:hypothetical protein|nr:hypothetical protein [Zoogloeaceae bacterium]